MAKKDPLKGLTKLARARRKLKMAVTGKLPVSEHSPAGQKHLTKKAMEKWEKDRAKIKAKPKPKPKPKAEPKVRKGSRTYKGASGSDLKELEKRFGKKT